MTAVGHSFMELQCSSCQWNILWQTIENKTHNSYSTDNYVSTRAWPSYVSKHKIEAENVRPPCTAYMVGSTLQGKQSSQKQLPIAIAFHFADSSTSYYLLLLVTTKPNSNIPPNFEGKHANHHLYIFNSDSWHSSRTRRYLPSQRHNSSGQENLN